MKILFLFLYICGQPYQVAVTDLEYDMTESILLNPEGVEYLKQEYQDLEEGTYSLRAMDLSDVDPLLCIPQEGPF